MKLYRDMDEFEMDNSVVAIGTFDGLHIGHAALIARVKALAQAEGAPALALTFDLLRPRPEVRAASVRLPRLEALRRFIESGVPLGEPALERATAETGDPELASVLEWSRAVNAAIAGGAADTPPFSGAREALARRADTACVSQTPEAALVREWRQHGLLHTVRAIAGQELGSKSDHLRLAAGGKYAPDRILMIGDAPGDYRAAQSVGARFYPILPGREAEAWERLAREAFPRFLEGAYGGAYEAERLAEFNALLPDAPPWRQA